MARPTVRVATAVLPTGIKHIPASSDILFSSFVFYSNEQNDFKAKVCRRRYGRQTFTSITFSVPFFYFFCDYIWDNNRDWGRRKRRLGSKFLYFLDLRHLPIYDMPSLMLLNLFRM